MFKAGEIIHNDELAYRLAKTREHMATFVPQADGLLVVNRTNVYYLTGTFANGILWVPLEGTPILFVRKSVERAALESPESVIHPFRSYGDILPVIKDYGATPTTIAVEKNALTWALSEMLVQKMPEVTFIDGQIILQRVRAIKTEWEITKMRLAGERHYKAVCEILPTVITPGMNELQIAHHLWNIYFSLGHCGVTRMSSFGEELFLGNIAAGENGYYPSHYNGPLGIMGANPATPYMGNAGVVWQPNQLLSVDTGFAVEGYNSDKTQVYFSGPEKNIPPKLRHAQNICIQIEADIARMARPGVTPSQLYMASLKMAKNAGFADGFMGVDNNKVPFLGHGIGLAVDEWPVMALKFNEPLQAGMVMAIEPKITLPGIGMAGTENTYLITEDGGNSLTGPVADLILV